MYPGPEAPPKRPRHRSGPARSRGAEAAPVRLRGVAHGFGELEVIERLDLEIAPGEVVGLVGPSGCGKSTLLELVAGLESPRAGTIAVDGATSAAERLRGCVYMPQRDLLLPWLTALDNAALGPRNRGAGRAEARARAGALFERFELAGFERARPAELSGGMRQRVAFLRTLLADKPVLLLDEPFAALDAITRARMQEWLAAVLEHEARTLLLVTHDVEEALYVCDRVAVLAPRPTRLVAEVRAPAPRALPRSRTVAAPEFVAARARALQALEEAWR